MRQLEKEIYLLGRQSISLLNIQRMAERRIPKQNINWQLGTKMKERGLEGYVKIGN